MAASWNDILSEATRESTFDLVRRKYLRHAHEITGRNIIAYYSGWLQKPHLSREPAVDLSIGDADKNGFMATIHRMDRSLGLDLIIHTPGGSMAATESLVEYLREMFGTDIRAIVPQIAMSAGTMIACACHEIVMGKQSSLGPIDPQVAGIPSHGLLEEFDKAAAEIKADPSRALLWSPILQKIHPTLLTECIKANPWAEDMVKEWLMSGMFSGDQKSEQKAQKVVKGLSDTADNKSHSRHIGIKKAKSIGLKVMALEENQDLQDAVLGVHHAFIATLQSTAAYKAIENHNGVAFILQAQTAIRLG